MSGLVLGRYYSIMRSHKTTSKKAIHASKVNPPYRTCHPFRNSPVRSGFICIQFLKAHLLQPSCPLPHLDMQRLMVLLRFIPAARMFRRLQMDPGNLLERALRLDIRAPVRVGAVMRRFHISSRCSMVAGPGRVAVAVGIILLLWSTIGGAGRNHRGGSVARRSRRNGSGAEFDVACAVRMGVGVYWPGVGDPGLGLLASEEWFAGGAGGVVV